MYILFEITAESYKQHYDEQGGDPQALRRILFEDVLDAVGNLDFVPLVDAMIAGRDHAEVIKITDSYAVVPETFEELEDKEVAL